MSRILDNWGSYWFNCLVSLLLLFLYLSDIQITRLYNDFLNSSTIGNKMKIEFKNIATVADLKAFESRNPR